MKQSVDITIILDRSGSMSSLVAATREGLSSFIEEQRKNTMPTMLSLVQFDDLYEVLYSGRSIKEAEAPTIEPRGGTALLDAIGKTISDTGKRLADLPENERPSKVIIVITTDGHENASREYTYERIAEMIRHQTDNYRWEFIYVGANQDAIAAAARMNIPATNSLSYAANNQGTVKLYASVSRGISHSNVTGQNFAFAQEDRDAQQAAEKSV